MTRRNTPPVLVLALLMIGSLCGCRAGTQDDGQPDKANPTGAADRIELDVHPRYLIFTEPKRPDGTIDYIAALNKKYSEGVTRDNNAFRDLFLLFDYTDGTGWVEAYAVDMPFFITELGLDEQALRQGPHFLRLHGYLKALGLGDEEIKSYRSSLRSEPFKAVQKELVQEWLRKNEPFIEKALVAVDKDRFYWPLPPGSERRQYFGITIPDALDFLELATGMAARCCDCIVKGDVDKAVNIYIGMRRFARQFASRRHIPTH